MAGQRTFIAPGQRFARAAHWNWHDGYRVTVLHVGPDAGGEIWVTYRDQDGAELAEPVSWFEEAVTAGEIVPVVTGAVTVCC